MKKIKVLALALSMLLVCGAATNDVASVQCWAVTKSGNRCKRRAAPGQRYCRQHAADRAPAKTPDHCRAMTTNGVPCVEKPLPNRNYCKQHGSVCAVHR